MGQQDDHILLEEAPQIEEEPEYERVGREDFLKNGGLWDSPLEDLKWVFQALGAKDLMPQDAPSPGAWSLLNTLQRDDMMLKSFYSQMLPKILPNRSQIDKDSNRVEDGREDFALIDRLLSEPDDVAPILSSTERRARELAVSQARS